MWARERSFFATWYVSRCWVHSVSSALRQVWWTSFFTLSSAAAPVTFTISSYVSPSACFSCWRLPRHCSLPSTMMVTLCSRRASPSISSKWCVVRTTDSFKSEIAFSNAPHRERRASGSIPADGSSRKMTGGPPIRAIATDSFRRFPPDSDFEIFARWGMRPSPWRSRSMDGATCLLGTPRSDANSCRCSCTVRLSRHASNCGQNPRFCLARCASFTTSYPRPVFGFCPMNARPPLGGYSPESTDSVVVFPAPFVPKNAKSSPPLTPKDRSCTATFGRERFPVGGHTFRSLCTVTKSPSLPVPCVTILASSSTLWSA
eukprot:gene16562-biopygen16702